MVGRPESILTPALLLFVWESAMTLQVLIFWVTSFLLGNDPLREVANKRDEKKLAGTWKIVSATSSGKPNPYFLHARLTFRDRTFTLKTTKGTGDISYTLDAFRKQSTIDLFVLCRNYSGIYEIKGDTLMICYTPPG